MLKASKKIFLLSLVTLTTLFVLFIIKSISPNLPKPDEKAVFYSNQCRQDLKMTTYRALKKAKNSIFLITYGLSDQNVINILNKRSKENLDLRVFYDRRSSPDIDLSTKQVTTIGSKGLLHQKILVIDDNMIFIGSANMTPSSLMMHDNLIIGLFSPKLAKFIKEKAPFRSANTSCMVGGQQVELWLLPDHQNKALQKMKTLISTARKSLNLAMFTLSHPLLVEELIKAKKRGVKVDVALDFSTSRGASSKSVEKLIKEGIEVSYNRGLQLCHHKYLYIDDRTLVCGSANWTNSAFKKNYDCFLILYNLSSEQKKFMNKLWRVIKLESSLLK